MEHLKFIIFFHISLNQLFHFEEMRGMAWIKKNSDKLEFMKDAIESILITIRGYENKLIIW